MENNRIMIENNRVLDLTKIWARVLLCVIVTLILTLGTYHGYRTYRIGKAIEKGYNPVVSRLAFTCGTYERLVYLSGNKHVLNQQKLAKIKK